jgi:hypothetical protein
MNIVISKRSLVGLSKRLISTSAFGALCLYLYQYPDSYITELRIQPEARDGM